VIGSEQGAVQQPALADVEVDASLMKMASCMAASGTSKAQTPASVRLKCGETNAYQLGDASDSEDRRIVDLLDEVVVAVVA